MKIYDIHRLEALTLKRSQLSPIEKFNSVQSQPESQLAKLNKIILKLVWK